MLMMWIMMIIRIESDHAYYHGSLNGSNHGHFHTNDSHTGSDHAYGHYMTHNDSHTGGDHDYGHYMTHS